MVGKPRRTVTGPPAVIGENRSMRNRLLSAYDAELRGEGELGGATQGGSHGPLWWGRYGDQGMVSYATDAFAGLDRAGLDELIEAAIAHFAAQPEVGEFEWKTRGHDESPGLHQALVDHGFEPEEEETVMIGEAALLAVEVPLPVGVTVRAAGDGGDLLTDVRRAVAMQDEVFGRPGGLSVEQLAERIAEAGGSAQLWFAEADDEVVSAGRLEVVEGTGFAGLWGGATREQWRGRGIYRAVTAARARAAAELGVRWIHSDCSPMSQPILARSGLIPVTTTTPYLWRREPA